MGMIDAAAVPGGRCDTLQAETMSINFGARIAARPNPFLKKRFS
jgi:hypothetical protein